MSSLLTEALSLGYASIGASDLDGAISSTNAAMRMVETPMHQGMVLHYLVCYNCLLGDNEGTINYRKEFSAKDARIKD